MEIISKGKKLPIQYMKYDGLSEQDLSQMKYDF